MYENSGGKFRRIIYLDNFGLKVFIFPSSSCTEIINALSIYRSKERSNKSSKTVSMRHGQNEIIDMDILSVNIDSTTLPPVVKHMTPKSIVLFRTVIGNQEKVRSDDKFSYLTVFFLNSMKFAVETSSLRHHVNLIHA